MVVATARPCASAKSLSTDKLDLERLDPITGSKILVVISRLSSDCTATISFMLSAESRVGAEGTACRLVTLAVAVDAVVEHWPNVVCRRS